MTSRAAFPAAEAHLVTVGGIRGATVMTGAPLRSAAHWVLPEELHAGVPKKILVTGGNAGIGFALCTQLAAKGCHVYLCARSVERGEAAVAAIREETPDAKVELVQCDTADDASVAAAAAAVKASLRGETLYAIVNNAGVNRGDPADIINVNVHGPKRVCEAFAPLWQSAGGRVVNVGELLTAPLHPTRHAATGRHQEMRAISRPSEPIAALTHRARRPHAYGHMHMCDRLGRRPLLRRQAPAAPGAALLLLHDVGAARGAAGDGAVERRRQPT